MIWQNIIAIIIALAGFPVGLLVAKMTKEELKAGRKWFWAIIILSTIGIIISIFMTKAETQLFLIASLAFILLLATASLIYQARTTSKRARKK